jgi:hypothetical protein
MGIELLRFVPHIFGHRLSIFYHSKETFLKPWGKGKEIEFHDGRSFSFFQTFPPFLFGFIWWRLS